MIWLRPGIVRYCNYNIPFFAAGIHVPVRFD